MGLWWGCGRLAKLAKLLLGALLCGALALPAGAFLADLLLFAAPAAPGHCSSSGQRRSQTSARAAAAQGGEDASANCRPPLLIAVGPQCCGKTTHVRGLEHPSGGVVKDISIDDSLGVYVPVPLSQLLYSGESRDGLDRRADVDSSRWTRKPSVLKALRTDDSIAEQRIVALALTGLCPMKQAASMLGKLLAAERCGGKEHIESMATLLRAMKEELDAGLGMEIKDVQCFMASGIRPGIASATARLREALAHHAGPVAWGNTNTRSRDFKTALSLAEKYLRPVEFITWGSPAMPRVPLGELLRRNLRRFSQTGKYVPVSAIADACQRTNGLLGRTGGGDAGELVEAAGFTMDDRGFVQSIGVGGKLLRWIGEQQRQQQQRQQEHRQQLAYAVAAVTTSPAWPVPRVLGQGQVLQMGKYWAEVRKWRHMKWERADMEPVWGVSSNETEVKKRSYNEPDTVDLAKQIKGWKKRRPRF